MRVTQSTNTSTLGLWTLHSLSHRFEGFRSNKEDNRPDTGVGEPNSRIFLFQGQSHVNFCKTKFARFLRSTSAQRAEMNGAVGLEPMETGEHKKNAADCPSGSSPETMPAFTGSLPLCQGWGGGSFRLCLVWGGKVVLSLLRCCFQP